MTREECITLLAEARNWRKQHIILHDDTLNDHLGEAIDYAIEQLSTPATDLPSCARSVIEAAVSTEHL